MFLENTLSIRPPLAKVPKIGGTKIKTASTKYRLGAEYMVRYIRTTPEFRSISLSGNTTKVVHDGHEAKERKRVLLCNPNFCFLCHKLSLVSGPLGTPVNRIIRRCNPLRPAPWECHAFQECCRNLVKI